MEAQGQATTLRTTSSKQTSKEREEEYGSNRLEMEEEELLDVYIQDSLHESPKLPSVFRVSLGGREDWSWEQATACIAKLREAVSGDEKQIAPPSENHVRRWDHGQEPGGWVG